MPTAVDFSHVIQCDSVSPDITLYEFGEPSGALMLHCVEYTIIGTNNGYRSGIYLREQRVTVACLGYYYNPGEVCNTKQHEAGSGTHWDTEVYFDHTTLKLRVMGEAIWRVQGTITSYDTMEEPTPSEPDTSEVVPSALSVWDLVKED